MSQVLRMILSNNLPPTSLKKHHIFKSVLSAAEFLVTIGVSC